MHRVCQVSLLLLLQGKVTHSPWSDNLIQHRFWMRFARLVGCSQPQAPPPPPPTLLALVLLSSPPLPPHHPIPSPQPPPSSSAPPPPPTSPPHYQTVSSCPADLGYFSCLLLSTRQDWFRWICHDFFFLFYHTKHTLTVILISVLCLKVIFFVIPLGHL